MTEGANLKTGVGLGLSFVLASQIYPFMLSSAFTARTIVKEKGEDDSVRVDLYWALALSVAASLVLAYFLHDKTTAVGGTIFSIVLFEVYCHRGDISWLPKEGAADG